MSKHSRREFLITGLAAAASTLPAYGAVQDLAALTLKQASEMIRQRDVSPVELTEACLKRIDAYNSSLALPVQDRSRKSAQRGFEQPPDHRNPCKLRCHDACVAGANVNP